ncbi:hypothetical protein [Burkholderia cepacia]|uniref:hypothetical protein n=1 Tax=Burkholderia cepacia TaxID=292 RepID=UPI0012D8B527|nr:hypothetical protein [Burkholderia cepacia]
MNDPIGALKAQRDRLEHKAVALRARVQTLTADLTTAVGVEESKDVNSRCPSRAALQFSPEEPAIVRQRH